MTRTLVAGFGNVLCGDDGFGVEVIRRLQQTSTPNDNVALLDVGIGGIRLAQELLGAYDRLIVVDAVRRGGAPGSVYVLAVDDIEPAVSIDLHHAIPSRALAIAKALGALPREVFLVGCEVTDAGELVMELSPPVSAAVDDAVRRIQRLVEGTAA